MFDDRTFDVIYLEIKLRNDELEREWNLEKLGIRARYQDANGLEEPIQESVQQQHVPRIPQQ